MKLTLPNGKILIRIIAVLLLAIAAILVFSMIKYGDTGLFLNDVFLVIAILLLVTCVSLFWKEKQEAEFNKEQKPQDDFYPLNNEPDNSKAVPDKAEKLFRALVENNEGIIALIDENFTFLFRSASAARITGWANEELEKISLAYVHPDDAMQVKTLAAEAISNHGKTIPIAARVQHKNGHYIWLEGTVTNLLNNPDINGIVVNLWDTTKTKEAEQKIIKANRLYFFISQINQMIVKVPDETTLFKEACRIAVDVGKFRMAWIGLIDEATKKLLPVVHEGEERDYLSKINITSISDVPEGRGPTGTAIREGKYICCNDIEKAPEMAPWKEAAIGRGYLSAISIPIKKMGQVTGAFSLYAPEVNFFNEEEIGLLLEATNDISFALDIFEKEKLRKTAEAQVLKSKQQYKTLTEVSPVGIFHTDALGNTTYVNPRWCQIADMSSEEALDNGWLKAVHEDDKEALISSWQEATKNQQLSFSEYRFVHKDGTVNWVLGQACPETNSDNQVVGYVGTITDITRRKKAEEKIAKIQKEKEIVLNRINDSVVSVDNEWRYTFLNNASLAAHPLGLEETIGKVIWDIHPDMKGTIFWDKYHEAMQTGKAVKIEAFYPPMQVWFSVKVYPSHDGLTIFYSDITERKQAAEKIRLSESQLVKAQQIGKFGYWHLDKDSDTIWASKEAMRIYGFPPTDGELPAEKISACIIDLEIVKQATADLVEHNKHNKEYNIEFRINPADGSSMKYICAIAALEKNETGEPVRIVGTLQDITFRKITEAEIIKEKKLSDSIINSLPGIFYLYNKEGHFLRWNENFKKVTMYSGDEISKMHPLDFFDAGEKELLAKKIANTFQLGEDAVQADLVLKTNKKIPYYFTGIAIEYEGSPCLLGVGIDFSERTKAQEEIKQTAEKLRLLTDHLQNIREEERKKIGREIHDELGQQLTAINMDVAWIDKKIPAENTLVKTKLKNIIQLLDGGNQSIRRILNELRPVLLDDYGLLDAIKWLGKQFTIKTGIPVKFLSEDTEINVSEQVANCIFRAYQEAFTNITRYAHANEVITKLHIIEDIIQVSIEDNGIGFDMASIHSGKSFGILGMKERVISLGGKFEMNSTPGKGTKIDIRLPVKNQTVIQLASIQ